MLMSDLQSIGVDVVTSAPSGKRKNEDCDAEASLSIEPDSQQESSAAVEKPTDAEAAGTDTTSSVPIRRGARFCFEEEPTEWYSPLFLTDPEEPTAAVNAGDYRLYVGGGSINRAFGDVFKKQQGLKFGRTSEPYAKLHQALLHASLDSGSDGLVAATDTPKATSLLKGLKLAAAFGRAGETLDGDTPGLEGSIGSVFVDVFEEGAQPFANPNVAMLYVVGPKGEECSGPQGAGTGQLLGKDHFMEAVERLGRNALESIVEYNQKWAGQGPSDLPAIKNVRWCLVSGGVYRHGAVSKVDVARATLRGMRQVQNADDVCITFAYDEDAFKLAAEAESTE